ncbi:MAG: DUF6338 family protein [Reyranellaceae bacterium]
MKGLDNVALILGFVVPGLVALFCRAQFLTGRVPPPADALLPCLALSFIYYAFVFPVIGLLPSPRQAGWGDALAWFAFIFLGPAVLGMVLGVWTQRDWGRAVLRCWPLKYLALNTTHQIPTAWDWKFGRCQGEWVLVTLKDGTRFAGFFGSNSFASSDAKDRDLYIEVTYDLDRYDAWSPRGSGVLIPTGEIRTVEFFEVQPTEVKDEQREADDAAVD